MRALAKITFGSPIVAAELPIAEFAVGEVAGRLTQALVQGSSAIVFLLVYLPRELPPHDAFSWSISVAVGVAALTWFFGLTVCLRARWWLRKRMRETESVEQRLLLDLGRLDRGGMT